MNSRDDAESAPQSRRQKELAAARLLLDKAEHLLAQVDESHLLRDHQPRSYPTFEQSEIKLGRVLGVGGFGIVFEVKDFKLRVPQEIEYSGSSSSDPGNTLTPDPSATAPCTSSASNTSFTSRADTQSVTSVSDINTVQQQQPAASLSDETVTVTTTDQVDSQWAAASPPAGSELPVTAALQDDSDTHYDMRGARRHMYHNVKGRGDQARYAVKKLHHDLNDLERARGMIDMAMEVKFLSVLWHPNIVKMRGYSNGPLLNADFFFVMDRLYETLAEKMEAWSIENARIRGTLFGIGGKKQEQQRLLIERLTVAHDMASAFWYMHQRKLVYRDIKQENVGFDVRGDVKIIDFGLSKALSPSLKAKDVHGREAYGYELTGRTGSIPYMAPEVALCKPYNESCDVFSFSVLLWEMLALTPAFRGYSRREFLERVAKNKERHAIRRQWPPMTRSALKEGWDHDPQKRPDMKRFATLLRGDLKDMSDDPKIHNRTSHMMQRSSHSQHRRLLHGMGGSLRGSSRAASPKSGL